MTGSDSRLSSSARSCSRFTKSIIRGVDDEQVAGRVVEEEVFIGLGHLLDVLVADCLFVGDAFAFQPLLEHIRRGMQVDHQVRALGISAAEDLVVAVVKRQFRVG